MQFLFNYLGVVLDIGQSKGLDNQGKHKVYFREKEIMLNEFILEKLKQIPEEYLQEVSDYTRSVIFIINGNHCPMKTICIRTGLFEKFCKPI